MRPETSHRLMMARPGLFALLFFLAPGASARPPIPCSYLTGDARAECLTLDRAVRAEAHREAVDAARAARAARQEERAQKRLADSASADMHPRAANAYNRSTQKKAGPPPLDLRAQLDDAKAACEAGNMDQCNSAGVLLYNGKGMIPSDQTVAAGYFKRACDKGIGGGCGNLGDAYYGGRGVPQDKEKALVLFTKGCKAGSDFSCRDMKEMLPPPPPTKEELATAKCFSQSSESYQTWVDMVGYPTDGPGPYNRVDSVMRPVLHNGCAYALNIDVAGRFLPERLEPGADLRLPARTGWARPRRAK